jgi:membrane protease YdiL (CAAX protease family)
MERRIMQLHVGEWVLVMLILGMVALSLWEADGGKNAVLEGRKTKVRTYQEAMLFMGVPTVFLMSLLFFNILRPSELGLQWQGTYRNWGGICLLVAAFIYFIYSYQTLVKSAEHRNAYRKAMANNYDWMMPSTSSELRWFILGLSMSAGICEELLFRGFIVGALGQEIGLTASLFLSSLLFGACHLYQGWQNVLRTAFIGLLLGLIYVFTELLWVVIALHITVDAFGGAVGYLLSRPEPS